MPGILPMKVIKVGSSSQSRIAQACDRCRSKKIRCDGIRPCCSQCSNVGFECKTSDKLSRRAFPRGYTESLEERVRSLESEVRELKDLLDEKDEKIDMLSRMHSNRRGSASLSAPLAAPSGDARRDSVVAVKEDVFRVQASPLLLGMENEDSYFMGASSGRAFVDALKRKIQESGKSLTGFNTDVFLNVQSGSASPPPELANKGSTTPPRMFSDRCVNVFFQEWAPLFPVLHKPTFLRLYEEYMSNPDQMSDPHKLAQLHLVFAIAGLSSDVPDRESIAVCEVQWRASLEVVLMDNSLLTLQCLVLALIYCISKVDYGRLQHYKGIAVGLSHRLGLHQSQKRFSFGALTIETRKKVFWTLYTVDCFSAALLGLPKLLKEVDIHAEYPSDTDDEYVTEKGFQPTLPGEYTKISSALALIRACRILSKVLDQNYPAAASHDLSLQSLTALENELNEWSEKLPQHLKLTFVQDKPSTDVTGSRSALLSLAYYYIRTLIHRPAVGSSLGNKSSPSVLSLADSSKHIIQIVQLLDERSMSFSFCLNKNETLTLCGLGLLYQGLDLKQEGKLMQDGQRLVAVVVKYLEKANAPGASDFKRLAASMLKTETFTDMHVIHARTPSSTKSTPSPSTMKKQLAAQQLYRHASASISEGDLLSRQDKLRRATLPNLMQSPTNYGYSSSSMDTVRSEILMAKREHRSSASQLPTMSKASSTTSNSSKTSKAPNLDYLSLNTTPISSQPGSPTLNRPPHSAKPSTQTHALPTSAYRDSKLSSATPSDWEVLLGSFDDRHLYDAIYGGGPINHSPNSSSSNQNAHSTSNSDSNPMLIPEIGTTTYATWSPEPWDYTTLGLGMNDMAPPQSVLSFSEESLSSGDDMAGELLCHDYKIPDSGAGTVHAAGADGYGFLLDGFEGRCGL